MDIRIHVVVDVQQFRTGKLTYINVDSGKYNMLRG